MGKNNKVIDLQDLIGCKVRMLSVMAFSHIEKVKHADRERNKYMYKCVCDCGNETLVNRFHLKQKDSASATWSCGCYQKAQSLKGHEKQKGKPRPQVQKPNGLSIFNTVLAAYRKGAEKRKLSFLLTQKEFEELTKQNCYYCGTAPRLMTKDSGHVTRAMNGVDRVDSNQGYEVSNCVPCCKTCNYMKLDLSKEAFLTQVNKIATAHPMQKKLVYLVTGAPGAGKSWVLSHLPDSFEAIDSDNVSKSKLVDAIQKSDKTPVVALTIGVSTFINRNLQFDIKLLVIAEDEKTIEERLLKRNGRVTPTLIRRVKRMKSLANTAHVVGTSSQVLDFFKRQ